MDRKPEPCDRDGQDHRAATGEQAGQHREAARDRERAAHPVESRSGSVGQRHDAVTHGDECRDRPKEEQAYARPSAWEPGEEPPHALKIRAGAGRANHPRMEFTATTIVVSGRERGYSSMIPRRIAMVTA